jgi:hypothetical protein
MDKQAAVLRYKSAVAVFRKWLSEEIVTPDEFQKICTMAAEKHGISSASIYHENACYVLKKE